MFNSHISNVTQTSFYQFRQIRAIHWYHPVMAVTKLVRAFVLTMVDYCNSILLGLQDAQLSRLQMTLNVSACLIYGARWDEHVTSLLKDKLHWLSVPECITYKPCWLTFCALNDLTCPDYLVEVVHRFMPTIQ